MKTIFRSKSSRIGVSLVTFAMLGVAPSASRAASDGTVGPTSTGGVTISVAVPDLIRISGLADIALGSYPGAGNLDANDDICVYTNKAPGNYFVTASGSGSGNAFSITDGSNTIVYDVFFNDATGTAGEIALTSGVRSPQQSGASTTSASCSGSSSANFHISISEATLQSAPAGAYSGVLTLIVEPA